MRVHHLAVVVTDLARAEAFYAGVLGLPVVRRWADDAGAPRAVWLALDAEVFLALERAGVGSVPRTADAEPGWHCVALAIPADERARWTATLAAAGHPVERSTAYTIYTRDPDGALVALSHYPTPMS